MAERIIELYRIPVNLPDSLLTRMVRVLSPDERTRADRYKFEQDRRRFIAARASMRAILGARLGLAPERVPFRYGPHGKPALAECRAGEPLHFNLSDSGDWAVLGLTHAGEIGVDIEALRPIPEIASIAERFFSPAEEAWLRSLPLHEQPWAFHRIWTCKEAYLKALGAGLSLDTRSFTFDFAVKPAHLMDVADAWTLIEMTPAPAYAGAVVAPGEGWEITWREWAP
ncbi:MAG TPA: 4'-phosphopantetheinyl transferase superfamily protein [Symbiobacteriaceae bacterium]|nr:4'-phosphopantetheinyl transferase superfamily protein [Symbiobacteriaceae bacterium]